MPKPKTRKSVSKRFRLTKKGKVRHKKAFARHLMTDKRPKRKRQLTKAGFVSGPDAKRIKRMLHQ